MASRSGRAWRGGHRMPCYKGRSPRGLVPPWMLQSASLGIMTGWSLHRQMAWTIFFRRLNQAGSLDSRALAPCKLAAIGPGTAAALGCRGLAADLVPPRFLWPRAWRRPCFRPGTWLASAFCSPGQARRGMFCPSQLENMGPLWMWRRPM